jgi:hypothetical protein
MTAQIPDVVRYRGAEYEVIGLDGSEPFDPATLGFRPVPMSTACWRGYLCSFGIARGRLRLNRLVVNDPEHGYPPINGIEPAVQRGPALGSDEECIGCAQYVGLRLPLDFTGRIRLARDFLPERYVHMGLQSPDAYSTVLDFAFQDGRVVGTLDRSVDIGAQGATPEERVGRGDTVRWIDDRFARRM